MLLHQQHLLIATAITSVFGHPTTERAAAEPIPGETSLYNSYRGIAAPYPGNITGAIRPTSNEPAAPDDLLFQNLLAAEWVVFSLYQQAVEAFNESSFTSLGFPNTTYDRISEIRDNEAGHLNIFYNAISDASIKPGPCNYDYGFGTSAEAWLATQYSIELTSMAFLTGLVQESKVEENRATLLAIGQVETRHTAWSLIDIWNTNPFSGPSDTVYPWADQILNLTDQFVVPGSCPSENPPYPYPTLNLPDLDFNRNTSTGYPGAPIEFIFADPSNQPCFEESKEYYAVFVHGLHNITMPFEVGKNTSTIPKAFDKGKGLIVAVIADEPGAPTRDSLVAGPLFIIEQPMFLTSQL